MNRRQWPIALCRGSCIVGYSVRRHKFYGTVKLGRGIPSFNNPEDWHRVTLTSKEIPVAYVFAVPALGLETDDFEHLHTVVDVINKERLRLSSPNIIFNGTLALVRMIVQIPRNVTNYIWVADSGLYQSAHPIWPKLDPAKKFIQSFTSAKLHIKTAKLGSKAQPLRVSYRGEFHKLITACFDIEELKNICLKLDIDYDNLKGEAKAGKTRELIQFFIRKGNIAQLYVTVVSERPHVSWPSLAQIVSDESHSWQEQDYQDYPFGSDSYSVARARTEHEVRVRVTDAINHTRHAELSNLDIQVPDIRIKRLPFWVFYQPINNKTYSIVMDGRNGNVIYAYLPVNMWVPIAIIAVVLVLIVALGVLLSGY